MLPTNTTRTAVNAAVTPIHSDLLTFINHERIVKKRTVKAMRAPMRAKAELMKYSASGDIAGISDERTVLTVLPIKSMM